MKALDVMELSNKNIDVTTETMNEIISKVDRAFAVWMLVAFHQLKNLGCICYGLTNASSNKGELQSNPLCLAMTIQHSFGDANIYIYYREAVCRLKPYCLGKWDSVM
jgi:hypothetical protein